LSDDNGQLSHLISQTNLYISLTVYRAKFGSCSEYATQTGLRGCRKVKCGQSNTAQTGYGRNTTPKTGPLSTPKNGPFL